MAECGPTLMLVPLDLREANAWVTKHHRHNKAVRGHKFCFGVSDGIELYGVLIAGRPVSRMLHSPNIIEVYRCCVIEGAPKGCCSMLYAAAWRCWKAQGGKRIITYTLQSEDGASLRGAGWRCADKRPGYFGTAWNRRPNRARQSVTIEPKWRWECP